jgi:uncharacterized protein
MPTEPTTFDAFRLARKREALRGEADMAQLPRLAQAVLDADAVLRYEIRGHVDAEGHPGALMKLSGRLPLRCERCNEALDFELQREVAFRFVRSEEELNALPIEDNEVEEVVGSASMALLPWIEDEAILSLPLVPRHRDCALPLAEEREPMESGRPSPFAVLGKLKRGDGGGPAGS